MKRFIAVLALLTGCASQTQIKRVDLTPDVQLEGNRALVCAFIAKQERLLCMTPQEWERLQEPRDPEGMDTGPAPDVIPLLESR